MQLERNDDFIVQFLSLAQEALQSTALERAYEGTEKLQSLLQKELNSQKQLFDLCCKGLGLTEECVKN